MFYYVDLCPFVSLSSFTVVRWDLVFNLKTFGNKIIIPLMMSLFFFFDLFVASGLLLKCTNISLNETYEFSNGFV